MDPCHCLFAYRGNHKRIIIKIIQQDNFCRYVSVTDLFLLRNLDCRKHISVPSTDFSVSSMLWECCVLSLHSSNETTNIQWIPPSLNVHSARVMSKHKALRSNQNPVNVWSSMFCQKILLKPLHLHTLVLF